MTKPEPTSAAYEMALEYAKDGLRVIPVHHKKKDGRCSCSNRYCRAVAKHPRPREWQHKASYDPRQIRKWFTNWSAANVGIVTGAESGIVVVDVDIKDGGLESFRQLADEHPAIMQARLIKTGSGGCHLYFKHPGGHVPNSVRIYSGIDIRGDNGMVLAPPSVHASGNAYDVVNNVPFSGLPLLPDIFRLRCHKESYRSVTGETQEKYKSDTSNSKLVHSVKKNAPSTFSITNLSSDVQQQIMQAVEASIPRQAGIRNQQTFELARRIQSIPDINWKEIDVNELKPVVEDWHNKSREAAEQQGFQFNSFSRESWKDFAFGWPLVEVPHGFSIEAVIERTVAYQIPAGGPPPAIVQNVVDFNSYDDDIPLVVLLTFLWELNQRGEADGFYLSCRKANEAVEAAMGIPRLDAKWGWRRLDFLEVDGVIECVKRGEGGTKGKSSEWRWIWTEKRHDAVDLSWISQ